MKKYFFLFLITCSASLAYSASDSLLTASTVPFDVNAATGHWLNTISGAARAKSDAYFEGGYWLQLWNLLYAIAIAGIFMLTGLSQRMKTLVTVVKSVNIQNFL